MKQVTNMLYDIDNSKKAKVEPSSTVSVAPKEEESVEEKPKESSLNAASTSVEVGKSPRVEH